MRGVRGLDPELAPFVHELGEARDTPRATDEGQGAGERAETLADLVGAVLHLGQSPGQGGQAGLFTQQHRGLLGRAHRAGDAANRGADLAEDLRRLVDRRNFDRHPV